LLRRRRGSRRAACGLAALGWLVLGGCTIDVGPPPESDPPLVPQAANTPEPPAQPSEPQPWSRDLNLDGGPPTVERGLLAEGLLASDEGVTYSEQRLTFESAFKEEERQLSPAELIRQRARERAAAAGLPAPPQAAAAPVEEITAEALPADGTPADGATAATPAPQQQRQSRLPPPPKFPPLPSETEAVAAPAEDAAAGEPTVQQAAAEPSATPEAAPSDSGPEIETAARAGAASFAAEAWDAPTGTILVQVSAVPDESRVVNEWQRLQARYPQVLKPLRLVVDEAKLGERGVFYRVQAGAFGSEDGATAACDALISEGQACFVVVR
jgi:hypothetical protein